MGKVLGGVVLFLSSALWVYCGSLEGPGQVGQVLCLAGAQGMRHGMTHLNRPLWFPLGNPWVHSISHSPPIARDQQETTMVLGQWCVFRASVLWSRHFNYIGFPVVPFYQLFWGRVSLLK